MSDSSCHLLSGIVLPLSQDFCSQEGRKCCPRECPFLMLPTESRGLVPLKPLSAALLSPAFFQLWGGSHPSSLVG